MLATNKILKEQAPMSDMILSVKTLPKTLFRMLPTEKVKVRKINGEVHLIPIQEKVSVDDCPLLGLYADGKLTVDKHLAWSRDDKSLEAK